MKKVFAILVSVLVSCVLFAESPFSWKETSWNTGTLYEYRVSGEGKKGIDLFVYVKDENTVSYFADQSEYAKQVFLYEEIFDKVTGVCLESNGKNPFAYAKEGFSSIESHMKTDVSAKKIRMWGSAWFLGKEKSMDIDLELSALLWSETSSFLSELWFMMRHLTPGTTSFDLSITNNGKVFLSNVKLEGTEILNGIECDKWTVTNGKKENHTLWFNKKDSCYSLIQYSSKGTGGYVKSPSAVLVKKTDLSLSKWEDFCEKKTEEVRLKLKLPEKI